jgi:putative Holliday junction resolvase
VTKTAGSILGLDPGERRIGVAMAVPGGSMALPLAVLDATGDWQAALAELVAEHGVAGIVVGLPVSLSGSEGAAAGRAREFAAAVAERLGLPVHLVDERLSTVAAGRALAEAGARGRRAKGAVDRSAAAVILQTWLDSRAGSAS